MKLYSYEWLFAWSHFKNGFKGNLGLTNSIFLLMQMLQVSTLLRALIADVMLNSFAGVALSR